ncbi:MAG: asparagine--tRNA ligase, partial [Oscillospiraceae bacterium]|nr:asparagine--tRNA ligase [Oscillospiraceae bacterium]
MIRGKYTGLARLASHAPGAVTVRGYIRSNRYNGHVGFIDLNDGTRHAGVQVVYEAEAASKYPTGASVEVRGELVFTPEARQPFEVRASEISLVGDCDADFPMQKKRHSLEFLRELPHLRTRTNTFSALFRVRNALSMAIHEYLQNDGFMYVAAPIITG